VKDAADDAAIVDPARRAGSSEGVARSPSTPVVHPKMLLIAAVAKRRQGI
jgi:hypothetical protein